MDRRLIISLEAQVCCFSLHDYSFHESRGSRGLAVVLKVQPSDLIQDDGGAFRWVAVEQHTVSDDLGGDRLCLRSQVTVA